ncbi:MAG: ABC transporter ATP-binding protein [Cyanobacteria bacterium P01_E01_bin.48]
MIEVEHLSKTYGDFSAIHDLTFRVERGEILGFLGPNGAGKTTSMRILTGYLPATSGTARVAGFDVNEQSMAVRQRIGYLPETPPLYADMTVATYLHFVAEIKRVSAGDRAACVDRVIDRCNLTEKRYSLIRKLSKGFRQRVGIAQALVHDPPAIVLDEPTVGLDPKQIIDVRNLIKSLAGEHTIVLSTHILPEVSMTCDRVVIVNRGRMAATGTPAELTQQLAGSQQVSLEIGGEQQTIVAAIHRISGINLQQLEKLPTDTNVDRWTARVNKTGTDDAWIKDLAAILVKAGLDLYEIQRSQASLEDIFLQLTTEETSGRAA